MNENRTGNRHVVAIASNNPGKVQEFRALLPNEIDVLTATELGVALPDETGTTFVENALIKARAVASASGLVAIADDSGLEVDALDGKPGVYSARFAAIEGGEATDDANNRLLLSRLASVPKSSRTARFRSVVAVVAPDGDEFTVDGVVDGTLLTEPRGTGGFGYDPLFVPESDHRTMAELSLAEKNAISHRGRAYRKAASIVRQLVACDSFATD